MVRPNPSQFLSFVLLVLAGLLGGVSQAFSGEFTPHGGEGSVNQGSYNYRMPIQLPPLPGQLQLNLGVGYSDRSGSGLFGSKADLIGLPKITRCASSVVRGDARNRPVTMTDSDRLCLDGNQLRRVSGSYWQTGTTYRTAAATYTRVTGLTDGFKVEYKNGNVAYLTYAVALSNQGSAYAWFAETIEDRYSNTVAVQYKPTVAVGTRTVRVSEALPETISYGQTVVSFQYISGRPIKRYTGLVGGAIEKTRLIKDIQVSVQNEPIRKYDFAYSGLAIPNRNLESVTECGKRSIGDSAWVCAEAAALEWQPRTSTFDATVRKSARRELTYGDGTWLVDVLQGDWNGDGISDLFSVSAGGRVVVHVGGSDVAETIEPRQLLSRQYQSSGSVRDIRTAFAIGDVNDDGRDDVVFAEGTFDTSSLSGTHDWEVLLAQPDGSARNRSFRDVPSTTVTYSDGGPKERAFFMAFYFNIAQGIKPIIADLTGTHHNEIVFPERTSSYSDSFRWNIYSTAFSSASSVSLSQLRAIPNIDPGNYSSASAMNVVDNGKRQLLFLGAEYEEENWKLYSFEEGFAYLDQLQGAIEDGCRPFFLDIHGDGLTDIVFDCGSSGQLFISNGLEWESVDSNISSLGYVLSPDRGGVQIGDVDGSGRSRLLVMRPSRDTWSSVTIDDDGDYSVSTTDLPYTLSSTDLDAPDSGYSDFINVVVGGIDFRNQAVQMGDFTGDGIPDFIQANAETNRWDLYSSAREQQYGIQEITDNLENLTTVLRTTLADPAAYVADVPDNAEFREAPLPLSVVEQVQSPDGRGGVRSVSFQYTGSNYHYTDLGFTGFDRIEETDSATGLSSQTTYEQEHSSSRWPLNGRPQLTETFWNDGSTSGPVQVKTSDWTVYPTSGETLLPYVYEEVSAKLDGNGAVASVTETSFDIDGGSGVVSNVVNKVGSGSLVNGRPVLAQIDAQNVVSKTNISSSSSSWLLGFVGNVRETSTVYNASGADEKVVETEFSQWPGTLDVASKTLFPNDTRLKHTEVFSYDSRGNLLSRSLEGNSNFEPREWTNRDFQSGQYPATQTAPLNSGVTGVVYDQRYGKKVAETGPNGLQRETAYDSFGRLIREETGSGVVTDYVYEKCEGSCSLPGQDAHQPWFRISKAVTHPQAIGLGEPSVTEYFDGLGRKIGSSKVGFNGELIHQVWKYDSAGREIYRSEPFKSSQPEAYTRHSDFDFAGRALSVDSYSANGMNIKRARHAYVYSNPGIERTVTVTSSPEGTGGPEHVTASKTLLDSQGNVAAVEEGVGTPEYVSTSFEHSAHGSVSRVQIDSNAKTRVTREFDAAGNLIIENDPNAGQTIYTNDALGNLVSHQDANGNSFAMAYDALNRMTSRKDFEESTQVDAAEWFYDQSSECNATGRFIGRLCLKTQSSGFREMYEYDALGRIEVTSTSIPGFNTDGPRSFIYVRDAFGREVARSYPNGFSTYFNYNARGYLQSVDDENGQPLKTVMGLDSRGNEALVQLGNGLSVTETFSDLHGNLSSTDVPGVIQETYTWFGNGSLYRKSNQGRSETYTYDGLGRLSATSGYDLAAGEFTSNSYTYDSLGNLLSKPGVISAQYADATRPHAVTRVTFDESAGVQQPVEEYQYSTAVPCPDGGQYSAGNCQYDVGELPAGGYGVITNAQCPSGLTAMGEECFEPVDWECSKYGFVSTGLFSDDKCGVVYKAGWIFGSVPDNCPVDLPDSRKTFRLFSGINKTCYDGADNLAACPAGSTQVPGEPKGTCVSTTPAQAADVTKYCAAAGSNSDATSSGILPDGGQCWQTETQVAPYCPAGYQRSEGRNLATDWNDADACYKVELVYPDTDAGETVFNYAYDDNGNVVGRGEQTLNYNAFNKPTVISSSAGTSQFWYGPDRARYRQDSRDGTTLYFGGTYEEVHSGSQIVSKAFVGDFMQVVTEDGNERSEYLHRDHLGSVRAVTDGQASVVALYEYAPFGKKTGDDPVSNRGFTDHEHLEESGLIHMNGRVYDPFAGRFLSPDPVVQKPYTSQNYNRYSYVLNNPLSMTDPSGYCFIENGLSCFQYALNEMVGVFDTAMAEWNAGNYGMAALGFGLGAAHSVTVLPVQFINQGIIDVGNNTYRGTTALLDGNLRGAAFHFGLAAGELTIGRLVQGPSGNTVTPSGSAASDVAKKAGDFDVHPRVAGQLSDSRMGRLKDKLTNDDLQSLANSPGATRVLDNRSGYINVIQNVEGKTLRITVPRDAMKIISVGPIRQNQVNNLLKKGDFTPLKQGL
jgi:RHS repeat-associated protein